MLQRLDNGLIFKVARVTVFFVPQVGEGLHDPGGDELGPAFLSRGERRQDRRSVLLQNLLVPMITKCFFGFITRSSEKKNSVSVWRPP